MLTKHRNTDFGVFIILIINFIKGIYCENFGKDSVICGDYKKSVLKNSTFEVFREIQSLREILGEDAYLLYVYTCRRI